MAFTVLPLKFSHTDRVLAVERTARTTSRDGFAAIGDMIREVEKGRGFLLGGVRGCGKTSLLNEVSLHFNSQVDNVVALGPLSLGLVTQNGLNSLGSQLRDWFRDNETRLPYPSSYQPTHADSLDAWLPFLDRLISQRNADTLLLLLDDLDSVPHEDREALLQDIQDSSWAKIATRTVLGCAENILEDEISLVPGDETYASGRTGPQDAVAVILKRETAVELLNALIIALGIVPPPGKGKGEVGKGGGGGYSYGGMPPAPMGKPPTPPPGGKPLGGSKPRAEAAIKEDVDATVYAPFQASPGNTFQVLVFAHLPEQAATLEKDAKAVEPGAQKRRGVTMDKKIKRGTKLTFNLTMLELEIDEPSQSCIWRGKRETVQFSVKVPENSKPRDLTGRVDVCVSSVPIGKIKFQFKIVTEAVTPSTEPVPAGRLDLYKQAFISYASKDRSEVFKQIRIIKLFGPPFFIDQLNLERGVKWEKEIYKYLDESDVVVLFWSKAASESAWVKKEIEYAIKRQAGNDEAPPDIKPYHLEIPPRVKPPPELEHLQFSDLFDHFIDPKEAGG